jgi:5''-nucleotidase/2'',3''-cyclic phosphodiesterase and related esterases
MKYNGFLKLNLILLICVFALCRCTTKNGEYNIEILATNDVHGAFFSNEYTTDATKKNSLSKVAYYINEQKNIIGNNNLSIIDLGDNLQGDICNYYSNFVDTSLGGANKHLLAQIYEYLGYDAIILGNHDIEAGHKVYDRLNKELSIPYLAANVYDEKSGKNYFKEYTIINKDDIKIAIIGFTNHYVTNWIDKSLYEGLSFKSAILVADSLVNAVKEQEKPDITILATHYGIGSNDENNNSENLAIKLAKSVKGIDVVFAAHDHRTYCNKVFNGSDSVLVIEAGSRASDLSQVNIKLLYQKGKLISKEISGEVIPLSDLPCDEEYDKNFNEYYKKVKQFATTPIGNISKEIHTLEALFGYTDYINFINTIQQQASDSDISIAAPLKTNSVIKAGPLTYFDLINIYPFENYLYKINLTGEQIKNYLEYSYANWINTIDSPEKHLLKISYDNNSGKYRFSTPTFNYDAAKGINYTVDVTKPEGSRVAISSMENGEAFDLNKTYTVAISSYRANGGGGHLKEGVGIEPNKISVVAQYPEIRGLIYEFFLKGNTIEFGLTPNWKFIPENTANQHIKRDKALISRR